MARVTTTPRTTCFACGEALLRAIDGDSDHCFLCRVAKAKGRMAWSKRMTFVRRKHRKEIAALLPEDPFEGFREE